MKTMSVKKYSELVGKSDKTIYKQIKKGTLPSEKVKKGYRVLVDANMLKCIEKLRKELDEMKKEEKKRNEKSEKKSTAKTAPKKTAVKRTVKKTALKPTAKKSLKKSPLKKRK